MEYYGHAIDIHVNPRTGGVVATSRADDGRLLRVCGEKPFRGCSVAEEMLRWIQWESRKRKT